MIRTWLKDPLAPSMATFLALVAGGFLAITLACLSARGTLIVAFQLPALISGGLGGLALIVLGAGLANAQVGRRLAAQERRSSESVLEEALAVADLLSGKNS